MKEKNKKFNFKKWYLMPIFVVVFLCVFGFSIVKPVKAESAVGTPSFIANNQFTFNISLETDLYPDADIMLYTENFKYSENVSPYPTYSDIAVVNDQTGESTRYGILSQSNRFDQNSKNLIYYNQYQFGSFITSYADSYLTFSSPSMYFVPTSCDMFTNLNVEYLPWFKAEIDVEDNEQTNNQYFKFVSCEFTINSFLNLTNDTNVSSEVYQETFTYDFQEDASGFNNETFGYTFESADGIDVYVDVFSSSSNVLKPYRLIDYVLQSSNYSYRDILYITDFKLYAYMPTQTQTTGIDRVFTTQTYVTKNSDIAFNLTNSLEQKQTLLSYNFTSRDWLQYEFYRLMILRPTPVDTTSWLLTAVGAFMNAELFPGFAIGGIFAVMVAFPLVIWFLKVVLGG